MNILKIVLLVFTLNSLAWADKLPVVASFSILADITQNLGGNRVDVTSLVGNDQDAHVYQMTSKDVKKLHLAKLIVVNGLGFEGASMERAIRQSHASVVLASRGIKPLVVGGIDPHAWHNPLLVQQYAKNITSALIAADPQGKAYYTQKLSDYLVQLDALDRWAQNQFKSIALNKRKVLTAHDAFAYLGQHYQITFIAPQGMSTEGEASAKTVANIIKQVRAEQIKAIFLENIKDGRLLNRLSAEAGVKPSGKLYSDALSQSNGPAATYLHMMRFNLSSLAKAMQ